jgi:hypothetical protein
VRESESGALPMGDHTPKPKLEKLRLARDAKFDEIVSRLSRELYPSPPSEADRERLIEEAEELTDNWTAAETNHRLLELSTDLQKLLNQHQDICKQIIEILDADRFDE